MNLCYREIHYEPALGQFLTADPHNGVIQNPLTNINKYTYALNNSTNRIDPSGEFSLKGLFEVVVGSTVGALLGPVGSFFGSLYSVNTSDEFSESDRKVINTIAIAAVVIGGGYAAAPAYASLGATEFSIYAGSALVQTAFQDGNFIENLALNFVTNIALTPIFAPGAGDLIGEALMGSLGGAFLGVTDINPIKILYNSRESVAIRKRSYFPQGKIQD